MLELEEEEEAMIKEQINVLDSALATEEPNEMTEAVKEAQ